MKSTALVAAIFAASALVSTAQAMPVAPLGASGLALELAQPVACTRDGFRGTRSYRNCLSPGATADTGKWKADAARRKAHRAKVRAANAARR